MSGAVEIATALVGPLVDAFKDAQFTPVPTVTFTETESTVTLLVQGAKPGGDATLTQDFVSDYWRGKLIFQQTRAYVGGGDTISAAVTLHHQAGDHRPHETDVLKGTQCDACQLSIISKNVASSPAVEGPKTVEVAHAAGHCDSYISKLTANIETNSLKGNTILIWSFKLEGAHAAHEPRTAYFRRVPSGSDEEVFVALVADERTGPLSRLELVVEYDMLDFRPDEIESVPSSLLTLSEVESVSPGKSRLVFVGDGSGAVRGTIATLAFGLPLPEVRASSYAILCPTLLANDGDGDEVVMGCKDLHFRARRRKDIDGRDE